MTPAMLISSRSAMVTGCSKLWVMFLLTLCICDTDANTCASSPNFNFTVTSRRNLTNHWILSVDVSREEAIPARHEQSERGIILDVMQTSSSCDLKESQRLMAQAIVPAGPVEVVPRDYDFVPGLGYYKMSAVVNSWKDAKKKCEEEGAHLVIINSEEEALLVKKYIQNKPKISGDANNLLCFLGVHDLEKEGDYKTVLDQPLSSTGYVKWFPGDPNGGTSANCITLHVYNEKMGMVDSDCNAKLSYICEY